MASDWVDRLKGLLAIQADGLMGAPPSSSSPDLSYSPLAKDSTGRQQRRQQQFRANDENDPFSLYRWYSSLSLKLSWLQTSHGTVMENLLLWIPRTWCRRSRILYIFHPTKGPSYLFNIFVHQTWERSCLQTIKLKNVAIIAIHPSNCCVEISWAKI